MKRSHEGDLGFTYLISKNDELEIKHHGKFATRFRKGKGVRIAAQLEESGFHEQQQLMARLTGNYKHGNERVSKNHSRNSY